MAAYGIEGRVTRIIMATIKFPTCYYATEAEQRNLGKYLVNSTLPEETGSDGFRPGPDLKSVSEGQPGGCYFN
ncbi:hypothetical protein GCK32_001678 [Trichostrongylus colubriformis]|uniref:Uncharacterized protein n=1 Tax=Trichostrongylus colubriformis TaxID=6319 RepID=A0AAN8IE04_TRICO